MLTEERGFTLVETLVAVSVFLLVVLSTVSVMFVAQRGNQQLAAWGDRTQQIRIAMQQITDDLSHAQWDDNSAAPGKVEKFAVVTYQPITSKDAAVPCSSASDWTGLSDWPGDLCEFHEVIIQYDLKGGGLTREVFGDGFSVSRSMLAAPLIPLMNPDGTENPDGSYFLAPGGGPDERIITVRLTADRGTSGVKRLAQIYSRYYLPQPDSAGG